MLKRKIKKIFHGALSLLVVFMVSFLGTSAANGNISLDSLTNGISRLVAMGESQLSETAAESSQKLSDNNLIDKIDTDNFFTANDNDQDKVKANSGANSEANSADSGSAINRLERVFFLKEAVHDRIHAADYVRLQEMPESLQQAVVAVEDRKFYNHWGFDMEGIFRASLVNLQYGEVKEGASTITQQLVKNLFLSQEQTMGRKAEEFVLAMDMELNYSKDEILELYLNTIYFGSGYYGIKEASEGYFGKAPAMLTLPEAAMLAGIPNAPSLYSPYVDFMLAKKRQLIVLDAMTAAGYLRSSVAEDAKIKPIYLAH